MKKHVARCDSQREVVIWAHTRKVRTSRAVPTLYSGSLFQTPEFDSRIYWQFGHIYLWKKWVSFVHHRPYTNRRVIRGGHRWNHPVRSFLAYQQWCHSLRPKTLLLTFTYHNIILYKNSRYIMLLCESW